MPTQTKFICPSGGVNVDLSGIFADLNGGTSYGTATKFKVGSVDLTGYFHASTGGDTPSFNTGFKITVGGIATDLSSLFRRRGFSGLSITVQPQSQTKNESQTCTFTITATTSSGTLTYQWKKWNGSSYASISGATSSSYTTPTLTASDDGSLYICTVSNGTSTLDSSVATLTVYYVTINTNPSNGSFNAGDSPSLGVSATVKPTTALYQWQYSNNNSSWVDEGGAVSSTYTLTTINSADEGYYRCRVSNNNSSVTKFSTSAYIQVYYAAVITSQPTNQTVIANGTNDAIFSISAVGKSTPTYQWQEYVGGSWTNVSGATSSSLTILNVTEYDNNRFFRCAVTNNNATNNSFGTTYSNQIYLFTYWIYITSQPSGGTVNENDAVSIGVSVNANPSPTYRWQWSPDNSNWSDVFNGDFVNGNGTDTNNITFNATFNDIGYYRCRIANAANTIYSNSVYLNVV